LTFSAREICTLIGYRKCLFIKVSQKFSMNYQLWTIAAIFAALQLCPVAWAQTNPQIRIQHLPQKTTATPNANTPAATETVLFTQTGQASWYGYEGGTVTATGERYNPQAMTAAHKTLAFGSRVRVTNTRTGKSAIVTINDRGPFVRGRIIDLSQAAAEAVGIRGSGVGNVKIEVLSYGSGKRKGRR
jgi:rare lipoprotein A (peptidoglycan hydrolase)